MELLTNYIAGLPNPKLYTTRYEYRVYANDNG